MADAPTQPDQQALAQHPLFNGKTSVGMISGENPRFPAEAQGHEKLGEALKNAGLKAEEKQGMYGAPEKSYMVYGPSREQMYQLGKSFGQESVVYSNKGKHELLYTNGPKAGKFHPAQNHEFFRHAPEDYYTNMPDLGGFLRLNFDWDQLHSTNLGQDAAVQALHDRAAAQQNVKPPEQADRTVTKAEIAAGLATVLRKAIAAARGPEHPLSYPWHNEHTDHHLQVMSPGVVMRHGSNLSKAMGAHPHMDQGKPGEVQGPHNDQAAGAGVSTYGKFALPYGTVDKSKPADLFHYPYQGKNKEINNLVKDHGFSSYYAGGKYGRPDLANRNYNTKHLMIYDPSPGSGGDFGTEAYTDGWRKIHELSHALTYPELNAQYGEGRRIGKLGTHRNLREALRAVHWEHLAAHKQRELSQQIGVHVPDHVFNKEYNTVMHDAIHRAVTGKFTEPSAEGFRPHDHKLPLEHALGMVRESAHNLGITGMHDLIKKNEGNTTMADDKVLEAKEWRTALAKGLQERVDAYSKQMLELRQRELKKNLGADPMLVAPAPAMKPADLCPLCRKEDKPGKCMCLQGPAAPMPVAQAVQMVKDEVDSQASMHKDDEVVTPPDSVDKTEPMSIGQDAMKAEGGSMAMCEKCSKSHVGKCSMDEVKPGPALDKGITGGGGGGSVLMQSDKKIDKTASDGGAALAASAVEKKEFSADAKAKEPVKQHKAGGNGIQIKALKKDYISPAHKHGVSKPVTGPAPAPKPVSEADHQADLKAAGMKKALGDPAPNAGSRTTGAPKLPGAAPKPQFGMANLAAGKAGLAAQGVKPMSPLGAPKLPGMGAAAAPKLPGAAPAAPKLPAPPGAPKAPAAGTAGLKPPPAPGAAKPGSAAPAAAAPKPMMAPKPAAPAAPKPMGKSEKAAADLKKSLGSCLLCAKPEHSGECA